MTTLAAIRVPGVGSWIASDTQSTLGRFRISATCVKWTVRGHRAIGTCGHLKAGQIIDAQAKRVLASPHIEDILVALEDVWSSAGMEPSVKQATPIWHQGALVVTERGLWEIDPSLASIPIPAGLPWAVGSGYSYALGAMQAITSLHGLDDPNLIVRSGIAAGIRFDTESGGEIWSHKLDDPPAKPRKSR